VPDFGDPDTGTQAAARLRAGISSARQTQQVWRVLRGDPDTWTQAAGREAATAAATAAASKGLPVKRYGHAAELHLPGQRGL
jgi:hypothetical protein